MVTTAVEDPTRGRWLLAGAAVLVQLALGAAGSPSRSSESAGDSCARERRYVNPPSCHIASTRNGRSAASPSRRYSIARRAG